MYTFNIFEEDEMSRKGGLGCIVVVAVVVDAVLVLSGELS